MSVICWPCHVRVGVETHVTALAVVHVVEVQSPSHSVLAEGERSVTPSVSPICERMSRMGVSMLRIWCVCEVHFCVDDLYMTLS